MQRFDVMSVCKQNFSEHAGFLKEKSKCSCG